MTERWDLSTPVENGDKTYWTRCGVMFRAKSGDGFNIILAANPVNGKLYASKPKEKDGSGSSGPDGY